MTWLCLTILVALDIIATNGEANGSGYIDLRKGAHMFYQLYYTTANVSKYTERPLVVWLQGGPEMLLNNYVNFEEIGPIDVWGNSRNDSWIKDMNLLFIDTPIGAGFSYDDNDLNLPKNQTQIAKDLVTFMKAFYEIYPEFKTVPIHIFGRDYSARIAAYFALRMRRSIEKKNINATLQSVVLGDPWISPIDTVKAMPIVLLQTGFIDNNEYDKVMPVIDEYENLLNKSKWSEAEMCYIKICWSLLILTRGINLYNVERPVKAFPPLKDNYNLKNPTLPNKILDDEIGLMLANKNFMVQNVSKELNITSKWEGQLNQVLRDIKKEVMQSAIPLIENLLKNKNVRVGVYSSQLNVLSSSLGTINWIDKMKWKTKTNYVKAPRNAIVVNDIIEGYVKEYDNFAMFWVNRAGIRVPKDNPAAMPSLRYFQ